MKSSAKIVTFCANFLLTLIILTSRRDAFGKKTTRMKKLYIFTLLFICSYFAKAQYTITSAIFPVAGEVENTWDADTTGITIGSAGTNQIWNYTGITVSPTTAVVSNSYVAKTSAPNFTAFPSASLANTSDGINYSFNSYGSNITNYGSANATVTTVYGNPQTIANIPFTYGYVTTDTYSVVDTSTPSQTMTSIGSLTTTGDAWGTLNMPGGKTYTNVLRLKVQIVQTATIVSSNTMVPAYNLTITANSYAHIGSVSKWGILSIGVSTVTAKSGTFTNTSTGKNVTLGDMVFAGINDPKYSNANFNLYPNPATGTANLWFVLAQNESYDMTITNNLGQVVRNKSYSELAPGPYNLEVDLKDLPAGIYYVKLKGAKQEGVKKLIIE